MHLRSVPVKLAHIVIVVGSPLYRGHVVVVSGGLEHHCAH